MRRKTDRTDAVVIAQYLAEHHQRLKAWTPPTDSNARLQELLRCRARVSAKLSSLRQLLRGVGGLAQASKVQQALHDLLAEIDQQISQLLASDEQLCRGSACLRTITGIGLQGSAMLAALFSRLPFGTGDSVVAYSGLDPRPHESGNSRGRRRLAKRGDPLLRRQMYLCAFAACHSKAFGPLYRSLKARGFKPTEAMVILARKLLRIAWAVWKTNQPFNPAMAPSPSACQTT
jgi:transposase